MPRPAHCDQAILRVVSQRIVRPIGRALGLVAVCVITVLLLVTAIGPLVCHGVLMTGFPVEIIHPGFAGQVAGSRVVDIRLRPLDAARPPAGLGGDRPVESVVMYKSLA